MESSIVLITEGRNVLNKEGSNVLITKSSMPNVFITEGSNLLSMEGM